MVYSSGFMGQLTGTPHEPNGQQCAHMLEALGMCGSGVRESEPSLAHAGSR